jgi:hypothetical protein
MGRVLSMNPLVPACRNFAQTSPTHGLPEWPQNSRTRKNISAYYRIQGPHLVIEYSPQRMGGDASMHVHTMYRDPTNGIGRRLVSK